MHSISLGIGPRGHRKTLAEGAVFRGNKISAHMAILTGIPAQGWQIPLQTQLDTKLDAGLVRGGPHLVPPNMGSSLFYLPLSSGPGRALQPAPHYPVLWATLP